MMAMQCGHIVNDVLYEWEKQDCEDEFYQVILNTLLHWIGLQELQEALCLLESNDETAAGECRGSTPRLD